MERETLNVANSTEVQTESCTPIKKKDKCKYPKSLWVCIKAYASIQFYFTTFLGFWLLCLSEFVSLLFKLSLFCLSAKRPFLFLTLKREHNSLEEISCH